MSRGNRIVIAGDEISNGGVVRHEILHALLRGRGHPRAQFGEACPALVTCAGSCAVEARERRLPREYVRMPPESLTVSSIAELMPRESDGQRWLALSISVHNARQQAVLVAAPGDARTPGTFSFVLQGPRGGIGGGLVASDSSMLIFAPAETKRWLFEFRVGDELSGERWTVSPGMYVIQLGYARRLTVHDSVIVER